MSACNKNYWPHIIANPVTWKKWRSGAEGYVLKTDAPRNVAKAIRVVAAGGSYFDNVVSRSSAVTSEDEPVVEELNVDELEVIKRVADGRTNVEIGADLNRLSRL